ncbi:MAG TPA: vitamin K epoxide reductase family protein, partial [Gemmatimonadales bacterium]|nr:vitamin K epoxide reductase family protein [Gemmatimonadales bacterium]
GVIGYAAIFAIAYTGLQSAWAGRRGPTLLLAALAAGGVLFTGYLTYLELFVIHAICRWCMGSAAIIAAICVAALAGLGRRSTA